MDTLSSILNLVGRNIFMTKIDIKSAYYSVKIHPDFQKYLKFIHKGTLYKFVCLPNGLSPGPRMFTKLLKPVMAYLRLMNILVAIYIDDTINLHASRVQCAANTDIIIDMFNKLGLPFIKRKAVVHPAKLCFGGL